MSKRILSLVLALVMVLGTFGTVFAADPTGNAKVDWLVERNLVKGDEGGLRLKDQITRAEVATMLVRALDLEAVAEASKNFPSAFSDMNSPDVVWSRGHVTVAAAEGLVKGYEDGTFGPRKDITYAEVATMLVRVLGGLTEAEEKLAVGMNWATIYLTKAAQLGIFEGVSVADYSAKAERGTMFEMVYNAIVNKEFGNYTIVKGIVLENDRVESLAKSEIVVEVIKEIQTAEYAKVSRTEKGDQLPLTVEAKVADIENLLGKVADFTLDKDGKVISVKVDTTYNYVSGNVTATKNKLTVGTKSYTVELDERYREKDERVFRTYLNDDAYSYEDFYQDPTTGKDRTRKTEFSADFAKVTVKNGKVLFIDAFAFEDIAPVESVKKDGAEIYVYNDQRDARVEKYTPAATAKVIGVVEKDGEMVFSRITREDINANDVVHVYKTNRLIVRQDAQVDGKFERVTEATRGKFSVQVDGERYLMNSVNYRRPVYSFDSKEFMTLFADKADRDLNGFRNEEVSVLLDINSDLQYIGAKIDFHEGIAIIDQILSRGLVKYVNPKNDKFELAETFDTFLRIAASTTNQRMSAFNRGDLTFVINDDDNIDTMIRLATANEINADAKLVKKNSTTKFEMNADYIRLADDTRYNLLNKTNVFRVEYKDGAVVNITGTTVADVRAGAHKDADLRAFVLTDEDFDDAKVENRSRTSGRDDVAHTIVFVDYRGAAASLDYETIRVTRLSSANISNRWIEGVTADGDPVDRVIDKNTDMKNITVGDIVELGLSKDDDKVVKAVERLIAYNAPTYKIVGMDSATNYRKISLLGATGPAREMWVSNSVKEFGTVAINDVVTFSQNNANDINVIRSYGKNEPVTGTWGGPGVPSTAGLVTYINTTGFMSMAIDGKTYYANAQTIVKDKTGAIVGMGSFAPIAAGDQVEVKDNVATIKFTAAELAAAELTRVQAKAAARLAQTPAAGSMVVGNDTQLDAAKAAVALVTAPALTAEEKALLTASTTPTATAYNTAETNFTATKDAITAYETQTAALDLELAKVPAALELAAGATANQATIKTAVEALVDLNKVTVGVSATSPWVVTLTSKASLGLIDTKTVTVTVALSADEAKVAAELAKVVNITLPAGNAADQAAIEAAVTALVDLNKVVVTSVTQGTGNQFAVVLTAKGGTYNDTKIITVSSADVNAAKAALTNASLAMVSATADPVVVNAPAAASGISYFITGATGTNVTTTGAGASATSVSIARGTSAGSTVLELTITKGLISETATFTVTVPTGTDAATIAKN